MKTFNIMLIEKDKIMPLIEKLSKAYSECDGKFAHIETEDFMFTLVGEVNNDGQ